MYPKKDIESCFTAEKLLKDYVKAKIAVSNLEAQLAVAKYNLKQIEIEKRQNDLASLLQDVIVAIRNN